MNVPVFLLQQQVQRQVEKMHRDAVDRRRKQYEAEARTWQQSPIAPQATTAEADECDPGDTTLRAAQGWCAPSGHTFEVVRGD